MCSSDLMQNEILIHNTEEWHEVRKHGSLKIRSQRVFVAEKLVAEFTMWVERRSLVTGFTVGLASGLAASVVIAALAKLFW